MPTKSDGAKISRGFKDDHDWADPEEFGRSRVAVEIAENVDALDGVATESFILVGQLRFMLDKTHWLDRYRNGDGHA